MDSKDLKILIRRLKKYNNVPKTREEAINLRGACYALQTEYLIRFLEYKRDKHGVAYCEKWLIEMLNLNSKPTLPNITYESSSLEDVDDELEDLAELSQNYKPGVKLPNKDLGWHNEEREIMAKSEKRIDLKNIEGLAKVEFWNLKEDIRIALNNLGVKSSQDEEKSQKGDNSNENALTVLINIFAEEFAKNAKYNCDQISSYIHYWEAYNGFSQKRSRAKKAAGLEKPANGTLENWEKKWKDFKKTRTEN